MKPRARHAKSCGAVRRVWQSRLLQALLIWFGSPAPSMAAGARYQRCRAAWSPAPGMQSPADWRVACDRACHSRLCTFGSELKLRVLLLTFRQ